MFDALVAQTDLVNCSPYWLNLVLHKTLYAAVFRTACKELQLHDLSSKNMSTSARLLWSVGSDK
jgi:hypothetical protein